MAYASRYKGGREYFYGDWTAPLSVSRRYTAFQSTISANNILMNKSSKQVERRTYRYLTHIIVLLCCLNVESIGKRRTDTDASKTNMSTARYQPIVEEIELPPFVGRTSATFSDVDAAPLRNIDDDGNEYPLDSEAEAEASDAFLPGPDGSVISKELEDDPLDDSAEAMVRRVSSCMYT